jgi:hypothetical protein
MAQTQLRELIEETPPAQMIACNSVEAARAQRDIDERLSKNPDEKLSVLAPGCARSLMTVTPPAIEDPHITPVFSSDPRWQTRYFRAKINLKEGSLNGKSVIAIVAMSQEFIDSVVALAPSKKSSHRP